MKEIPFQGRTYLISYDSSPEALSKKLSEDDLKRYLELLQLVQLNPKKVYAQVKDFCVNHLSVPEVVNLLTFAHIQNFKIREAENLIEKTFVDHPEYLFARVNFADQCLRKRQLGKIKEIFPSFDLREQFPEKESFHFSEFRAFVVMLGFYFLAMKDKEKAHECLQTAKEIDPNDQSLIFLEKKILKQPLLTRLLRAFSLKK